MSSILAFSLRNNMVRSTARPLLSTRGSPSRSITVEWPPSQEQWPLPLAKRHRPLTT
jgi:hypothetical protein